MIYREGTVGVTLGLTGITGTGTQWFGNIVPGNFLTIVGFDQAYHVAAVTDDTHITLSRPIEQDVPPSVLTSLVYSIVDDFTAMLNMPIPGPHDVENSALIARALQVLDAEFNKTL